MRPKQLIEKVGPDTLRVVFVAFDDAWAEIAANYSDDGRSCPRQACKHAAVSDYRRGERRWDAETPSLRADGQDPFLEGASAVAAAHLKGFPP